MEFTREHICGGADVGYGVVKNPVVDPNPVTLETFRAIETDNPEIALLFNILVKGFFIIATSNVKYENEAVDRFIWGDKKLPMTTKEIAVKQAQKKMRQLIYGEIKTGLVDQIPVEIPMIHVEIPMISKKDDTNYVLNPLTRRYIKKDGRLAKKLMSENMIMIMT
jgi:hypothetical protein